MTQLSIGEVSQRTGLGIHTLRLYEREGLLLSAPERHGNRRSYTEADVQWLETCRLFRSTGMPLATIARFAALVRDGEGNERERLALLKQHEERMAAMAVEIERARELIAAKVTSYEQHLAAGTAASLWT